MAWNAGSSLKFSGKLGANETILLKLFKTSVVPSEKVMCDLNLKFLTGEDLVNLQIYARLDNNQNYAFKLEKK